LAFDLAADNQQPTTNNPPLIAANNQQPATNNRSLAINNPHQLQRPRQVSLAIGQAYLT
jgi:hypothetical protein